MAQRVLIKAAWDGHFAAQRVMHELLVKALHSRQYRQFKPKIFGQKVLPNARFRVKLY
jgi:hypothetical protein